MRSSLLRLAMVLGVGLGLVGCQSSGSGGLSFWPWKKKEAETLVEDTTTPKLPSKLAQPQVLNQQGYGQYAATGGQATVTPPATSMGTQTQPPIYTAAAPQYGQSTPGAGATASPGATPVGYSPTPPPSGYSATPNYASTGYPSMIQGGSSSAGSTYNGQATTGFNPTSPVASAPGYTTTPTSPGYGAPAAPTTPSPSPGLGSSSPGSTLPGTTPSFGNTPYPPNLGSQVPAATPSSTLPGQTGYQPGQTGYQPGQTGYNPPATVSPGSLPGMTPSASAPGTSSTSPARSNTPYRPGSTSDYIPGTLPGAPSSPTTNPGAATSPAGAIPSGVPATPGYVPPTSSTLPGQSINGTSGSSTPSATGDGHSGHHH